MAFTKINAAGIGTTETVTVDGLTVINDGSFGGNLTVSGVLTYEDVTNVDSVGLITARNGIVVGSGITLSKDGDVFFTGIATGNGSGLTNLPAANLTGTLPAISGANLTGIDTDLVSDTSPQLGGNLDVNTKNIVFGDSGSASDDRLTFGAGTDLSIYHGGDQNYVSVTGTGNLNLTSGGAVVTKVNSSEDAIVCNANGSVDLYHDNELQVVTAANGLRIKTAGDTDTELSVVGPEGRNGIINLEADDGDDNADIWGLVAATDGTFLLRNYASGSYETNIKATGNGAVELYYDNTKRIETTSSGVTITNDLLLDGSANLGNYIRTNYDGGAHVYFKNNSQGANYSSHFQTYLSSDEAGTTQTHIHYYHGGYCELLHQGDSVIRTLADGVQFRDGGAVKGQFTDEGLCFGTDTASANALDDYEEGSFTPTMKSSNNLPTFSYSHQRGKYVKVGRQVTVWIFVYATIGGTETGNLNIEGLPFTVRDEYAQILITDSGNWGSYPSNHSGWGGYAQLNDNHVVMLTCGDKDAGGVHASNWGNNTYLYATMSYMTDS